MGKFKYSETFDKLGMVRCDLRILLRDLKEVLPDLPEDDILATFAQYTEHFEEYVKNIQGREKDGKD